MRNCFQCYFRRNYFLSLSLRKWKRTVRYLKLLISGSCRISSQSVFIDIPCMSLRQLQLQLIVTFQFNTEYEMIYCQQVCRNDNASKNQLGVFSQSDLSQCRQWSNDFAMEDVIENSHHKLQLYFLMVYRVAMFILQIFKGCRRGLRTIRRSFDLLSTPFGLLSLRILITQQSL